MSNFDNISLEIRDRFGRWTSPAIENNSVWEESVYVATIYKIYEND